MAKEESKPSRSAEFSDIMEECLARLDDEGIEVVEQFCATYPQYADRINRQVSQLLKMGLISGDPTPCRELPERLGGFRLGSILGSGGMGVVYQAEEESLGREVAVKLIRPEHLFFPNARERFRREINAVARLVHPGIVPIYSVGEEEGVPFFAMELVHGVTLQELLAHLQGRDPGRLSGADLRRAVLECLDDTDPVLTEEGDEFYSGTLAQVAFRIAMVVAEALAHAHACGVLHRDVKPSNILITPNGRPLLFDFGLAHIEGGGDITRSGAQIGSAPYMAPEQIRGDTHQVGAQVDVYGLGVTLYELLTLRPPFPYRDNENVRDLILTTDPVSITRINHAVATDARLVCMKAMAPDRTRRYLNAMDLARDLRRHLDLEPVSAHPPSPWYRFRRCVQRHPARTTAIGALLVAGLIGPILYGVQEARAARKERQAANLLRQTLEAKEREFQRAEVNLAHARQAIDTMLTKVSKEYLSRFPKMDMVREGLLKEAMSLYGKLEPNDPDDPRHGWEQAKSLLLVGTLQTQLGQLKDSRENLLKARRLLDGVDKPMSQPGLYSVLADVHLQIGVIDRKEGSLEGCYRENETCIAILEDLIEHYPGHWRYQSRLITSLLHLVNLDLQQGRTKKAEENLRASEVILAAAKEPKDPEVVNQRSLIRSTQGLLHHLKRDYEKARAYYTEALDLLKSISLDKASLPGDFRFTLMRKISDYHYNLSTLAQQHGKVEVAIVEAKACLVERNKLKGFAPDRPTTRFLLAQINSHLADLFTRTDKGPQAVPFLQHSIRTLESLVEEYPRDASYRRELGMAYGTLAPLVKGPESTDFFTKALRTQENLVRDFPASANHRNDLAMTLYRRIRLADKAEDRLGFADRAVAVLRRKGPDSPPHNKHTRKLMAFSLVEGAKALTDLKRPDEAVARLAEAVNKLGMPRRFLRDGAFLPLLERKDFQTLLQVGK